MAKKKSRKKKEEPKFTCNCIELVNQKLEEVGSNTVLLSDVYRNLETFEVTSIRVKLQVQKRDSRSRNPLSFIKPSYCPICGKKYDADSETKPEA